MTKPTTKALVNTSVHSINTIVDNIFNLSKVAGIMRLTPETKQTYKFAMKSYENYCKKNEIAQDLDSLLKWIVETDNPNTQMTYIAAVKKVLSHVYKDDPRLEQLKEDLDSIRVVKVDKAVTESGYLKPEEVKTLLKVCPVKIRLMVEVLFQTGLRISPMLNIKLKDLNLIEKVPKKKSYYEVRVVSKGAKEGRVFISVDLVARCKKEFQGQTYLFEHDGKKYTRQYATIAIKKAGALIGRPEIHAHTLRHSFGTHLVRDKKLTIDQVQRAMHHANPTTTVQFYIHGQPSAEDLGIFDK